MKRPVESRQRQTEDLEVRVDGTGTASIVSGSNHVTLTDNGTGDYTLTITKPGARLLGAWFTPIDADVFPQIDISDSSKSAVNVVWKNVAGTPSATDCDFYALIRLSGTALET